MPDRGKNQDRLLVEHLYFLTMITSILKSFKRQISKGKNPEPEFTKRIKLRYASFWGNDFSGNVARLPLMYAEDPMTKWKASKHWQRLLENKHNSREFAKKCGCRVPVLYWQGKDCTTLDFDSLPAQYVIRPTVGHSAKGVFLMQENENLLDRCTYTKEDLMAELQKVSVQNPDIEFLCEEFLTDENGNYKIPDDYKFYMFSGELACIQVINRYGPKQKGIKGTVQYYDEHWNPIPKIKESAYADGEQQPAPKCLPEMISCAKKLSKEYQIFVRVDLYASQKGAVFGEFCPTPARGNGYTAFGSKFLIDAWDKNCKDLI